MNSRYEHLLTEARKVFRRSGSVDEMLTHLRGGGASPIEALKILRSVQSTTLANAKCQLGAHPAWKEVHASRAERIREIEREAIEEFAGEERGERVHFDIDLTERDRNTEP